MVAGTARFAIQCLLFIYYRLFPQKQHAECVSAAMRRDSTSCTGDMHLFKGGELFYLLYTFKIYFFVTSCVCDKYTFKVDVRAIAYSVGYICAQNGRKLASIFFCYSHFSVLYGNARLEMQKICSERRKGRASASLV